MPGRAFAWTTMSLVIGLGWPWALQASECTARSGPHRTTLVELYTSEGCSSCPPADRWLSGLQEAGLSPATVVPLAFHVDYWNRLGWTDRFSQAAFSERQRSASARNRLDFVYTPQFLIDGRDVRAPGSYDTLRRPSGKEAPAGAAIEVRLAAKSDQVGIVVDAQLAKVSLNSDAQLFIAITEDRLASPVAAGENRGRLLRHDAVVRALLGPVPAGSDDRLRFERTIALPPEWTAAHLNVAAFVQDARSGDVLQALALPLCR